MCFVTFVICRSVLFSFVKIYLCLAAVSASEKLDIAEPNSGKIGINSRPLVTTVVSQKFWVSKSQIGDY